MPHRRVLPATAGTLVVLASCGSAASTSLDTVATTVPPSVSSPSTTDGGIPVATSTSDPIDESAADSTEPLAGPLSMQGTLLPDDAFPWEMQRRTYDDVTFDYGPFQSSCRGYEVAEQFAGRSEATAFWWVDGGNANHWVGRETYPGEGVELVAAVAGAAADCGGVVSWGEGGSMEIEALDLGIDIGGFSMVTYPGDDLGFVAASTHGDLVSVLWVPMWTDIDGEFPDLTPEAFAAVARQAHDLLRAAGPATPDELRPATTTTPGTTSPDLVVTTTPPGTRPDMETATSLPRPTTTTVPPSGLALLVLTPDDLGNEWTTVDLEPYSSSPSDSDLAESCPAAASIDAADAIFEWESDLYRDDGANVAQLIGRAPDADTAIEIAEQFAGLAGCQLDELFGGEVVYTGGPVQVDGATAAGELTLADADQSQLSTTVLMAVGDLLIVVGVDTGFGGADLSVADVRELALRLAAEAARKAAAG